MTSLPKPLLSPEPPLVAKTALGSEPLAKTAMGSEPVKMLNEEDLSGSRPSNDELVTAGTPAIASNKRHRATPEMSTGNAVPKTSPMAITPQSSNKRASKEKPRRSKELALADTPPDASKKKGTVGRMKSKLRASRERSSADPSKVPTPLRSRHRKTSVGGHGPSSTQASSQEHLPATQQPSTPVVSRKRRMTVPRTKPTKTRASTAQNTAFGPSATQISSLDLVTAEGIPTPVVMTPVTSKRAQSRVSTNRKKGKTAFNFNQDLETCQDTVSRNSSEEKVTMRDFQHAAMQASMEAVEVPSEKEVLVNGAQIDKTRLTIETLYLKMGMWNPIHMSLLWFTGIVFLIDSQVAIFIKTAFREELSVATHKYTTLHETLFLTDNEEHTFAVDIEKTMMFNEALLLIMVILVFESRKRMVITGLTGVFFGSLAVAIRHALMQKIGVFMITSGAMLARDMSLLIVIESVPYTMRNVGFLMAVLGRCTGGFMMEIFLVGISNYNLFPFIFSITITSAIALYLCKTRLMESTHFLVFSKQTHEINKYLQKSARMGGQTINLDIDQLIDDVLYHDTPPATKMETFVLIAQSWVFIKHVVVAAGMLIIMTIIQIPEMTFLNTLPVSRGHLLQFGTIGVYTVCAVPIAWMVFTFGRRIVFRLCFLAVFFTNSVVFTMPIGCTGELDGKTTKFFSGMALIQQYVCGFVMIFVSTCQILIWMPIMEFLPCDVRHIAFFAFEVLHIVALKLIRMLSFTDKDTIYHNTGCAVTTILAIVGCSLAAFYREAVIMPVVVTDIIPSKGAEVTSEEPDEMTPSGAPFKSENEHAVGPINSKN